MKKIGLAGVIALFVAPVFGQISEKEIHRPTPLPDRIVLTWRNDPARSQAVTWRTDTSVAQGLAQIALAEAGPEFKPKAKSVQGKSTVLKTDLGEAHYHTVHFQDLKPKTQYVYRVGDGSNWSEWSHFQTAREGAEPFSFLYFGDSQYDHKEHWSRLIREAYAAAPRARFLLHAGDLVNNPDRDAEWGEWFQAGGWINLTVPTIPTPGNHEYFGQGLTSQWRAQFALPDHGPAGLEGTVFYLDFQGVRVICLNSNELVEQQVPWLERLLANNPNRWTIVAFHHPIYPVIAGRDNLEVKRLWQPLFDKYRVDLVLQGHDHSYGRSGLESAAGQGSTVYVVSVSGPRMYDASPRPWMVRFGKDKQLFQVVHIEGDRLRYESRTVLGMLFDSFELHKQPGQPNLLIEGPHAAEAVVARSGLGGLVVLVILSLAVLLVAWKIGRRRLGTVKDQR